MPTGTATISFGTSLPDVPASEASVTVTGQTSILSTSFIEAWIMAESTASNTTTDHLFAGVSVKLVCGDIVVGTGFTIYATCIAGLLHGDLKVKWVYT